MTTSEQVSWTLYRNMSAEDRRAVDALRGLGHDLTSAVLHCRRTKLAAAGYMAPEPGQERTIPPYGSPRRPRRKACEHEAAHTVVARSLGMPVTEAVVNDDASGHVNYDAGSANVVERLAVLVAPEVWFETRRFEYPEGDAGCAGDREQQVFSGGDAFNLRQARVRAHDILREHRDEVLQLADRLVCRDPVFFTLA